MKISNKVVQENLADLAKVEKPRDALNTKDLENYEELADAISEGLKELTKEALWKVEHEQRDSIAYTHNNDMYKLARQATSVEDKIRIGREVLVRNVDDKDSFVALRTAMGDRKTDRDIRTGFGRAVGSLESFALKAAAGEVDIDEDTLDRLLFLDDIIQMIKVRQSN
jgi:hypothetical protein